MNAKNNYEYPIPEDKLVEIRKRKAAKIGMGEGLDFIAQEGTPVLSACKGKVFRVDKGYTSNGKRKEKGLIMIRHENDEFSRYTNFKEIVVNEGQNVEVEEILGFIPENGEPFFHFEVIKFKDKSEEYETLAISFTPEPPEEAEEGLGHVKRRHHSTM